MNLQKIMTWSIVVLVVGLALLLIGWLIGPLVAWLVRVAFFVLIVGAVGLAVAAIRNRWLR